MMFCAAVVYPLASTGRFDIDYFVNRHAPMFAESLGDICVRYEVHRPLSTPGAPAATFVAAAYFWVRSGQEFGAALARHQDRIYGDIPNFTDLTPTRSWSEVIGQQERRAADRDAE